MVYTVRISAGQRARVVDIRQKHEVIYLVITFSEMSTLQSPVLNMSTNVKKSSRLGRENNTVFQKIERP